MLTLAWEYLLGRLVASDCTHRDLPEWPPHPDRVFQALVASWGALGEPVAEREALEWLESLPPPVLRIESETDPEPPLSLVSFVPVNDAAIVSAKSNPPLRDLPIGRNRQPRTFPRVPFEGICYLTWCDAAPDDRDRHLPALGRLCLTTPNLGHSSSLVRMWATDAPPSPEKTLDAWAPDPETYDKRLRVPSAGRLGVLIEAYAGGGADWTPPPTSGWQGYRRLKSDGTPAAAPGVFSPVLSVLKTVGPNARRYNATFARVLAEALRKTLMARADANPRALALLSGHAPDGAPLEEPHCAFIPLPFVGSEYADGHLLGMALVLPRGLPRADADACLQALALALDDELRITLRLGRDGTLDLQAADPTETRDTLRPETWCAGEKGATTWATVTPIVLDRFPPRRHPDPEAFAAEQIAQACERVGLPTPAGVESGPVSKFVGAPTCRECPHVKRKADQAPRWHVHAAIRWSAPVRGPVLLGAGRYRGLGLLRPLKEERP